jgi:hypothetical protein
LQLILFTFSFFPLPDSLIGSTIKKIFKDKIYVTDILFVSAELIGGVGSTSSSKLQVGTRTSIHPRDAGPTEHRLPKRIMSLVLVSSSTWTISSTPWMRRKRMRRRLQRMRRRLQRMRRPRKRLQAVGKL